MQIAVRLLPCWLCFWSLLLSGFATPLQATSLHKKINFVFPDKRISPNPDGWEAYEGAVYSVERGYGWLPEVPREGGDGGARGSITLADGTTTPHADINAGVAANQHWIKVGSPSLNADNVQVDLYKTSLRLTGPEHGTAIVGLMQHTPSPSAGHIRYATRVSLFTGEGSLRHIGAQEAGVLLLADPSTPSVENATFVGIAFDSRRTETKGWLRYRVGNGPGNYRTDREIPDTVLPIKVTEEEHEIGVVHDTTRNILSQILVNGTDVTHHWSIQDRAQQRSSGLFGIRSALSRTTPHAVPRQFYWYFQVERM
jgi:hypothetical protein